MPFVTIKSTPQHGAISTKLFFDVDRYIEVGEFVELGPNSALYQALKAKNVIDSYSSRNELLNQGFVEVDPKYNPQAREISIKHPDFIDPRYKAYEEADPQPES